MDLATFLSSTTLVPIADLTSLAALRECAGDDVLSRFRSQIELRQAAGVTVLDGASQAGRQNLLASEQRDFDRYSREIDQVLTLIRQIEQRQYAPPPSQRLTSQPDPEPVSPVLARGQSAREWLTKRGGARYVDERGADRLSFGRILRGLALGNRQGMSDLELRVMSEGSGPAGQYTVPEVLSAGFIDQVRAAMVCMRAGAQIVPMTSETLSIARVASGPTVAWKSENSAITPGDLTLERVRFTARTLPVLVKMSVELSEDSTNIDAILERELAAALAVELDRV
jgi:HK97 family phage major capsid protein